MSIWESLWLKEVGINDMEIWKRYAYIEEKVYLADEYNLGMIRMMYGTAIRKLSDEDFHINRVYSKIDDRQNAILNKIKKLYLPSITAHD